MSAKLKQCLQPALAGLWINFFMQVSSGNIHGYTLKPKLQTPFPNPEPERLHIKGSLDQSDIVISGLTTSGIPGLRVGLRNGLRWDKTQDVLGIYWHTCSGLLKARCLARCM